MDTKLEGKKEDAEDTFHDFPIENLINTKKECDRKKIKENKDNFLFNVHKASELKIKDLLVKITLKDSCTDESDESSIVLQERERKILRKCRIRRRRQIEELDIEVTKRKTQEKLAIPHPVVQKIVEYEFELGNMIDEANSFLEGKCLVFDEINSERELEDDNINQNRLFMVKDKLKEINEKFMNIDDQWVDLTSQKNDILTVQSDMYKLKNQSLDLLQQKDDIIGKLFEGLDELLIKSSNETFNNSNNLMKLNKVAKHKIKFLNEEHNKHILLLTKLIEDETNKKYNKDSAEWKLLMDKIIANISSSAEKRMALIEKQDFKLIKQYETNEEDTKNLRISMAKKYIGVDTDLELVKLKCSENVEKLQHNCFVFRKRIEENNFTIVDLRRRMFILQELAYKLNEEYKKIESDCEIQTPIIKTHILRINKTIDQREERANSAAKKDNSDYIKLWHLQQNNIMRSIYDILQIDHFIHEYLDISNKTSFPCEKLTISTLPLLKYINNSIISNELPESHENNSISNSYERIRDKALNKLLFDFIVKNSSFVFDHNLNEVLDMDLMQNLPYYAYNAFGALQLNKEESWNLIKFKFKQLVMCNICNSQVNWESDEIPEDPNIDHCSNITSDNICTKRKTSSKFVLEKVSTHITRINENIDKVKRSNIPNNFQDNTMMYSNNKVYENINEDQNTKYFTTVTNYSDIPSDYNKCKNVNHELNIDNKHFMPIIKEILKEIRPKPTKKPKSFQQRLEKNYNFIQCKINENDLREYWSQFTKYIPSSSVDLWKVSYKVIGRYYDALVERQKKMLTLKTLRKENDKLNKIKQQLNIKT